LDEIEAQNTSENSDEAGDEAMEEITKDDANESLTSEWSKI